MLASRPPAPPLATNLTFSDPDLTDLYPDQLSTTSTSNASSEGNRHPRGDEPLRFSHRAGEVESPVSSRGGGGNSSRTEMPSLERLMAFLDGDEEEEQQDASLLNAVVGSAAAKTGGRDDGTPRREWSSTDGLGKTPAPSAPRSVRVRRDLPFGDDASRRRTRQHAEQQEDSTGSSAPGEEYRQQRYSNNEDDPTITLNHPSAAPPSSSSPSPSIRARDTTLRRPPSARFRETYSAPPLVSNINRQFDLPDSPSPRPGSVAELRRSLSRSGFVESSRRVDVALEVGGEEEEDQTASYASGHDVTRLAEEVLREFETIVNPTPSLHSSRPPSRLRNIPSPPTSSTASTSHATPAIYPPISTSSDSSAGVEGRRGARAKGRQWSSHSQAQSNGRVEEAETERTLKKLEEAREYIAVLQRELRSVVGLVGQLREEHEAREEPQRPRRQDQSYRDEDATEQYASTDSELVPFEQPRSRGPARGAAGEEQQQAAWEVAQHILSLLPSPSSLPSLQTLSSSLDFTRDMDSLVHGVRRRDDEVFTEENLQSVRRRVGGWERAVRGG